MSTYGVTSLGFLRKTQLQILADIETDELTLVATNLDVSPDSVVGQLNGIFSRQLGIGWEQLELCYHAFDPDVAEGRLLEMLGKLTGTFRRGSTASKVILNCTLDNGTVLTPLVAYAETEDKPDIRWTVSSIVHPSGFTAPSSGVFPVTFVSEQLGEIEGFAGTINVISTPITGWKGVVNPDDAEIGLLTDLDPAFRVRRETELATIGSATIRAITANVSQAFGTQIQTLVVFENDGDNVDSRGLLPHSVEVLIFDGDVPTVDNNALAQVIFDSKAGGIHTSGSSSGTANALVNGVEATKTVLFSRASQLPVYLEIDLIKKPGAPYPGDAAVAQAVVTAANAYFGPGDFIIDERLKTFTMEVVGVKDVSAIRLGLTVAPTNQDNIPISIRQIGRFSTSHVVINAA